MHARFKKMFDPARPFELTSKMVGLLFAIITFFLLHEITVQNLFVGWDTTDSAYAHFLFLVDSFKNLQLPLYNYFTLGGVPFWENFNSANTFNLIDLILAGLSQVIDPLYAFQLQFTIFTALSAFWFYQFLKFKNYTQFIAITGAYLYAFALAVFLIGQISFFFPFVFLAYLLGAFPRLILSSRFSYRFFSIIFAFTLMIKSAPFFLPFFMLFAFLLFAMSPDYTRKEKIYFFIGFALMTLLFAGHAAFYYNHLKNVVADLHGNFITPEPRLRSLIPIARSYYDSFFASLIDLYDGRFRYAGYWTNGINSLMFVLNFVRLIQLANKRRVHYQDILLFSLMVLFLLFASGVEPFRQYFEATPLINTHRWGIAFVYFSQIASLLISLRALNHITTSNDQYRLAVFVPVLALFVLTRDHFTLNSVFSFVGAGLAALTYYFWEKKTVWVVFSFSLMLNLVDPHIFYRPDITNTEEAQEFLIHTEQEKSALKNRKTEMVFTKNERDPGRIGIYDYNNRSWFYQKQPTMEGYNNAIHPIFWYLKGQPFMKYLVIPLCNDQFSQLRPRLWHEAYDNAYLERSAQDIYTLITNDRCAQNLPITEVQLTPEKITFKPTTPFSLILLNTESFHIPENSQRVLGGMLFVRHRNGGPLILEYNYSRVLPAWIYFSLIALFLLIYFGETTYNLFKSKKKGLT